MKAWVFLSLAALMLAGCNSSGGFRSPDRAERLMALAAGEAGAVPSAKERLSRQLNIAHMQTREGNLYDARDTLAKAQSTLKDPSGDLDEHTRIAGWVSVSELSRAARDPATARQACKEADHLLHAMTPADKRCQYVRGLAEELEHLDGKAPATALLREAGAWTVEISPVSERRAALQAFASDLFMYDDYDGGLAMLKRDSDAAWRSDTLAALAQQAIPMKSYGTSLQFESNFMNKSAR